MADEDTRSLSGAAQAALRTRAVRAVLGGMSQAQAARVFGVHHNAVNRWIKRHREGGWAGLGEQRRGRRPGEQAALTELQQQEIIALVRESTPDQLGLPGFLWTRDAVAELIGQRYGRWLARTTVGGYLRGWGFSPQKPQRRALEQNPAAVAPGHDPGHGPIGQGDGQLAGVGAEPAVLLPAAPAGLRAAEAGGQIGPPGGWVGVEPAEQVQVGFPNRAQPHGARRA
jgi:transposase